MFTLQSCKHKYSRGIKLIAQCAYIAIGNVGGLEPTKPNDHYATITIHSASEDIYLTIPDDKLQSVIDRLIDLKTQRGI